MNGTNVVNWYEFAQHNSKLWACTAREDNILPYSGVYANNYFSFYLAKTPGLFRPGGLIQEKSF